MAENREEKLKELTFIHGKPVFDGDTKAPHNSPSYHIFRPLFMLEPEARGIKAGSILVVIDTFFSCHLLKNKAICEHSPLDREPWLHNTIFY